MTARKLPQKKLATLDSFTPWWMKCSHCDARAEMWPHYAKQTGEGQCSHCGSIYSLDLKNFGWPPKFERLPLWLKARFRNRVFWALNGEHLSYLESVIGATLREKTVHNGRRIPITRQMPFNLPAWLLSAKNREDLLKLIERLRVK